MLGLMRASFDPTSNLGDMVTNVAKRIDAYVNDPSFYSFDLNLIKKILDKSYEMGLSINFQTISKLIERSIMFYGEQGLTLLNHIHIDFSETGIDGVIEIMKSMKTVPFMNLVNFLLMLRKDVCINLPDPVEETSADSSSETAVLKKTISKLKNEIEDIKKKVDEEIREREEGIEVDWEGMLENKQLSFKVEKLPECKEKPIGDQESRQVFDLLAGNDLAKLHRLFKSNPYLIYSRNKKKNTLLCSACIAGWANKVQYLVEAGSNIDGFIEICGEETKTPLMTATQSGHSNIVKYLLSKGAKVDGVDIQGTTPLMIACQSGHLEIAKILMASGANVQLRNNYGLTPLMFACNIMGQSNTDIIKFLISRGADTETKDNEGRTVLMYACDNYELENVKYLVMNGSDIEAVDNKGLSPLGHLCIQGRNTDFYNDVRKQMARFLLEVGANPERKNNEGLSYYFISCHNGHISDILKEFGASEK